MFRRDRRVTLSSLAAGRTGHGWGYEFAHQGWMGLCWRIDRPSWPTWRTFQDYHNRRGARFVVLAGGEVIQSLANETYDSMLG